MKTEIEKAIVPDYKSLAKQINKLLDNYSLNDCCKVLMEEASKRERKKCTN